MRCPACGFDRAESLRSYLGGHEVFSRMSLARCAGCTLVFAYPQPPEPELAAYYASYWSGEVAVSLPSTRRYYLSQALSRVHYIRRIAGLQGTPAVLDMGAGLGLFHDALARLNAKHAYTAVESDRDQLAALKARLGESAACRDLAQVPPENAFDLAVLAHVLEHMARPHELVAALAAKLRPGGLLFVEVPNGDYRYKTNFESHLLFFNPASLKELLSRHGAVLDVSTVGREAAKLHITQVHPERSVLRPLKEALKSLIAAVTPAFHDREIARYEMSIYGGDRQWLRALVRCG